MHLLRTIFLALLGLVLLVSAAAQPQRSVLMTWDNDTPNHIVDQARDALLRAGGVITHEYRILKGFAATASAKVVENVAALSADSYPARIEDDQVVNAYQPGSS